MRRPIGLALLVVCLAACGARARSARGELEAAWQTEGRAAVDSEMVSTPRPATAWEAAQLRELQRLGMSRADDPDAAVAAAALLGLGVLGADPTAAVVAATPTSHDGHDTASAARVAPARAPGTTTTATTTTTTTTTTR